LTRSIPPCLLREVEEESDKLRWAIMVAEPDTLFITKVPPGLVGLEGRLREKVLWDLCEFVTDEVIDWSNVKETGYRVEYDCYAAHEYVFRDDDDEDLRETEKTDVIEFHFVDTCEDTTDEEVEEEA